MVILTQNHRMFVDTENGNLTQFFITPSDDKKEFWVCTADMKMTDATVTLLASYSSMSYATLNLEALYRAYALGTRSYEMLPDYKKTAPKTEETAEENNGADEGSTSTETTEEDTTLAPAAETDKKSA